MLRHSLATLDGESSILWHIVETSFAFGAILVIFSITMIGHFKHNTPKQHSRTNPMHGLAHLFKLVVVSVLEIHLR